MPWVVKVSDIASVNTLNQNEMENNAALAAQTLRGKGWTLEAISGALGNMQRESSLNPGSCEIGRGVPNDTNFYGGGLGCIQWTDYPPYEKQNPNPLLYTARVVLGNVKPWYDGDQQMEMLARADDTDFTSMGLGKGPFWGWQTSTSYPSISFDEFKKLEGAGAVEDAARYFFYDMEWHSSQPEPSVSERLANAAKWYEYLSGHPPIPPGRKKKGMPLWMYLRRF